MPTWLDECIAWWSALAPEWAFLFLLPFAVAAAAFLADAVRTRFGTRRPAS
jgi:hypothetical protein